MCYSADFLGAQPAFPCAAPGSLGCCCPAFGSILVVVAVPGSIFSLEKWWALSSNWQLLSQPLCLLKLCCTECTLGILKMWNAFCKYCYYGFSSTQNRLNSSCSSRALAFHGSETVGAKTTFNSLEYVSYSPRAVDATIIEHCFLYFLLWTVMLSWENLHWNPFYFFCNMSFSWNNPPDCCKRVSVWAMYFLKRERETFVFPLFYLYF